MSRVFVVEREYYDRSGHELLRVYVSRERAEHDLQELGLTAGAGGQEYRVVEVPIVGIDLPEIP